MGRRCNVRGESLYLHCDNRHCHFCLYETRCNALIEHKFMSMDRLILCPNAEFLVCGLMYICLSSLSLVRNRQRVQECCRILEKSAFITNYKNRSSRFSDAVLSVDSCQNLGFLKQFLRQDFPIWTLTIFDLMIHNHKLLCYLCITAENLLQLPSKTFFFWIFNKIHHFKSSKCVQ